jgi:hypothetical protein
MVYFFYRAKMSDIRFGVPDYRHHPPLDGTVGPEKIKKRYRQYKNEADQKTAKQKKDLGSRNKFFVMIKMVGFKKIKQQKNSGNNRIVDAVF